MAIRRRRKKLTSLVSRLDERVRSVELRPINLLTSGQVDAAVEIGEATAQPTNVVSGTAPNEFRKVQDAYYYSKALTGGSEDRVAIYLESDLDLEVGETLEISGIHGTNDTDIDVSGTFEVKFADTPPWDDRESWKHDPTQDQLAGVTITNEYSVKPETLGPATWGSAARRLQTKRLVDTFSITDTTVTLTMNATHKFKVDDVIFVDIFAEDSRAYGADGLFKITAVTSDTIEYELAAGVDTPTGTITPSADVYVFPVARNFIPVGSTWSDSSTNKIYVWDGVRWVDYSAADVEADGDPPSAPTNLSISSEITFFQTATPVVEVSVSWTAPTTSESGDPLTDLLGYTIKYRRNSSEPWKVQDLPFTDTSYTFSAAADFQPGTSYDFEVYAYDSGNLYSEALTGSHTTESAPSTNIALVRPEPLDASIYLGTVTLTWEGAVEDTSGNPQTKPDGLVYLDIHKDGNSAGFTPSASNLIATISAVAGNKYVDADITYGNSFYYKAILRDASGTSSLPSTPTTAQAQSNVDVAAIQGIIEAANITPGTIVTGEDIIGLNITGDLIRGNTINAGVIEANSITADQIDAGNIGAALVEAGSIRTASTGARVELNDTGIYGYNSSNGVTFRVLASTGDVFIASGVQIGGYATDSELNNVASTANTANNTATSASNDVNSLEGNVYFPGTTEINGGNIRTGTVDAQAIVADSVLSGTIKTASAGARIEIRGSDSANPGIVSFDGGGGTNFRFYANGVAFIDSMTVAGALTGGTIQTSTSGQRVVIRGDTDSIQFRDTNGNLRGEVEGITTGLSLSSGALSGRVIVGSGVQLNDSNGTIASFTNSGQILTAVGSSTLSANMRHRGQTLSIAVTSSDSRLKDSITQISNGLSLVTQLNPVTFNSKVDETDKIVSGFLAQDVANVLPISEYTVVEEIENTIPDVEGVETMGFDENPMLSLNHVELIPYLTKAIQELSEKNSNLEARLEALEGN